jgi:hypothetical protein
MHLSTFHLLPLPIHVDMSDRATCREASISAMRFPSTNHSLKEGVDNLQVPDPQHTGGHAVTVKVDRCMLSSGISSCGAVALASGSDIDSGGSEVEHISCYVVGISLKYSLVNYWSEGGHSGTTASEKYYRAFRIPSLD